MTRARPLVVGLLSLLLATACGNSVSTSAPPTTPNATASTIPPPPSASADASPTAFPSPTVAPAPTNDRIQYEATASASLIGEAPVVVCLDGVEYEGPNGFQPAPDTFSCGVDAFVDGFRSLGFAVAGYTPGFEQNRKVKETVSVASNGRWRWDYSADSPQFSGPVSATVWLDPASGKIVEAARKDPIGKTTWTIDYDATFPPIAVPSP